MSSSSDSRQEGILAIDDEKELLQLLKMALECRGYKVYSAACPIEALKLYETHRHDIKLVLLDFSMPEMKGDQVFERLQQINPEVRVVLLTAYDRDIAKKMFERGLQGYLQKPFCLDELARTVRTAIESPAHPPLSAAASHSDHKV